MSTVKNGRCKGLITTLAFNATLAAGCAQAEVPASIWGDTTDVSLGLAASYTPRYMGSKNYTAAFQPMLRMERGIFFLDSLEGLGVQWQSNTGFSASASLGYDYGRADGDSNYRHGSDTLKGMGEVSGATVLNLNASQKITSWLSLNAQAELRMAGETRGDRYAFGAQATLLDSDYDTVTWRVDAHAGSGRFNQTYFGVTQAQSATSRFALYTPDQGIYAYTTELAWRHAFDQHWSTAAVVELTHYTDQVRNSPIISKETTTTSYVGVSYIF
ncbi:MipA/OmpV family protein [Pseudomonas vranovensis]|uniref:MipA/OmpV family protein n=1 Tax=Pseudomonas vranovensis TaxID=321661 RepID=UPI000490E26E|nr:MipA/OmpV family protein [Pseudomonas vranovensis]